MQKESTFDKKIASDFERLVQVLSRLMYIV